MRLEHFVQSISLTKGNITLSSRELQSYYRLQCIPQIKAASRSRKIGGYEALKGVVLNFFGQIPNKQMLCVGELTWRDYLFSCYDSQSNLTIIAGLSGPRIAGDADNVAEGPFGWNTSPFVDVQPEGLAAIAKPGFSVLALVAGYDFSNALTWLKAAAPMLVGGGRFVICGETRNVDALVQTLDPKRLTGLVASADITFARDTAFKVITGTSLSLADAFQRPV